MGASCCKSAELDATPPGGTLTVMFNRIDKDGKGFIDLRDLQALMKDDFKAYFQGRGAEHIMQKYGTDGKMSFENFQMWWNGTYTTYNEDVLGKTIDDVLEQLPEEDEEEAGEAPLPQTVPSNTNVAISRS